MRTAFMCAVFVAAEYLVPTAEWLGAILGLGLMLGIWLDFHEADK